MSTQVEFEANNVTAPMRNSSGMRCIGAALVTQNSQAINLSDYFGGLGEGHYITFQADGAKVYVSFASNSGASIDEQTAGNGTQVCWPIPDGQQQPYRIVGGREVGTGYATLVQYNSGIIVHAKLAISGVATGWLRFYRSSVAPTQGLEQFKPVGF